MGICNSNNEEQHGNGPIGRSNGLSTIPEINAGGAPRVPLDIYNESAKGVCKLIIKELYKNATGFFLTDVSGNKFLVTNNHVISKDIVDSNMTIIIEIYNKQKYELKLNKNQRDIKTYENPIDITIIRINDLNDLCSNIKFLSVDLNYKMGYHKYINRDIYLLGYPYGKNVECSSGKIKDIINNELKHNCNTDSGSSGSPIILVSNSTVIGIHKAGIIKENINIGTFLGFIFNKDDNILNNNINTNNILRNYNKNIIQLKSNNKKLDNNNLINSNKNIIYKNNINNDNYIISEIYIKKDEVNKNIQIINSYEEMKRSVNKFSFEEKKRNVKY